MNLVKSPCIMVCKTDSNGVCFGCKRTLEEISNWSLYSNVQKQAVIDQLNKRGNSNER